MSLFRIFAGLVLSTLILSSAVQAREWTPELRKPGERNAPGHAGVYYEHDSGRVLGVLIGTPADAAGIQVGDVLVNMTVNGTRRRPPTSGTLPAGLAVTYTIQRNGRMLAVALVLAPYDPRNLPPCRGTCRR